MTGYGKATVIRDNRELTVELKSVNHRYLDISTKIPRMFVSFEDLMRSVLTQFLARGHVDVFLNYCLVGDTDKVVTVDMALAKEYVDIAHKLSQTFPELHHDFNVNALMHANEVLSLKQAEEDESVIREMVSQAMYEAVQNLNAMRETEGNKLREDLLDKLSGMENLLQKVKQFAPQVALQYREKLYSRISEALAEVPLDEARLANEVCFFADKCCIDEEITRLSAHLAHAREILAEDRPVGRKLDFLVQEINRETNTICSKSSHLELTNVALEMKNEIEKIREQIQNLE